MNIKLDVMLTLVVYSTIFILAASSKTDDVIPKVSQNSSPIFISSSHRFAAADDNWAQRVIQLTAVKIEEGCGRMQNRLVTFEDGTKACARYRVNSNLMQGEIYSYFLAKLLRIPNLPPLALTLPDLKKKEWSRVAQGILDASWQPNKLIILTKYIKDTREVVLPQKLRTMQASSITPADVTPDNKDLLAQWSDMIVFDYIIGNMDRLINSLHNKQWNSHIMNLPVHNLAQKDNSLIFFDNEDGMFHGYQIMDRYSQYHEQSLQTMCVFRRSTASAVNDLLQSNNLVSTLTNLVQDEQPEVLKYLPKISSRTVKTLSQRLLKVSEHIKMCEERYPLY